MSIGPRLLALDASAQEAAVKAGLYNEGAGGVLRWGEFTFSYKKATSAGWQPSCRWHKKNDKTGCKKTFKAYGNNSVDCHVEAINRAKLWCSYAKLCASQKEHSKMEPSAEEVPADDILKDLYPSPDKRGDVKTDEELRALGLIEKKRDDEGIASSTTAKRKARAKSTATKTESGGKKRKNKDAATAVKVAKRKAQAKAYRHAPRALEGDEKATQTPGKSKVTLEESSAEEGCDEEKDDDAPPKSGAAKQPSSSSSSDSSSSSSSESTSD